LRQSQEAIGDISRFPSAKKLVGYSGLGSSVSATGQTYRTSGITKQGRRDLRAVLVEAAWIAVEHHPHWTSPLRAPGSQDGQKESHCCHRPQTARGDVAGSNPPGG
jgi:transposase